MTRINTIFTTPTSVSWGKKLLTAADENIHIVAFAALLIICSVAVGCSSDKPKPVTSNNQTPSMQPPTPAPMPAPIMQSDNKPAPKKPVQRRKPATVNYADKTYGVTFEYPRRYAIETGDAASQLVSSNPIPMNFVQPGGQALAAVELPETNYVNTDFSSAFFNVSVNKTLSEDQCGQFAVPAPKETVKSDASPAATEVAKQDAPKQDAPKSDAQPVPVADNAVAKSEDESLKSKLLVGDTEFRATEAVSGQGTRQSDSKFFHMYQNGACYEFVLNVTTDASEEGLVKHVDRDKIFNRLEQILATVKVNPVTPEVTAEAPSPAPTSTPAQ